MHTISIHVQQGIPFFAKFLLLVFFCTPANAVEDTSVSDEGESCNTIEYFYTMGCPHCFKANIFLRQLESEYPDIIIKRYNVVDMARGGQWFFELMEENNIQRPGVPAFLVCDQLIVGYGSPGSTGRQIKSLLGLDEQRPPATTDKSLLDLPLLGKVSLDKYGLPLFTIIIGLVDGFNPCAMWVLLFLLTLLVNLRSRLRIVLVAGTFVLISGLVYFAFMAAWLNLFLVIGFSRAIQIAVGLIAVIIGSIHIKDFFAFKKGVSLSIPETAKPGLYARMRDVIYAENLWASMIAVIILAVLVNMVELMCTAGLPAAYTQILTLKELPLVQYYAYLALYNVAYILDDALMVTIVVYTLSRTRMQEKAGRVLKFVSGSVIMVLGLYLLFFPELMF